MSLLFLTGLLPEVVQLLREVYRAVKSGDHKRAREAAERAAIVQAFRLNQQRKRLEK